MVEIVRDSLEERIVRYLQEHFPAIQQEMRKALHVPREVLERHLRSLERRGIVERDIIPGRTYVRLLLDVKMVGVRKTQKRAYRRGRPPRGPPRVESDPGPAYG